MRPVRMPLRSTMRTCERASPVLSSTVFHSPTGVVTFAATLTNGSNDDPNEVLLSARVLFCDPQPDRGPHDPRCAGRADGQPVVLSWDPKR